MVVKRSWRLCVLAVISSATALVVGAAPVGASCYGPPRPRDELSVLFEGRAIEWLQPAGHARRPGTPNYRWVVDKPVRGVQAGDTVDIVMAVEERRGNLVSGSSHDIGPAPRLGARYLVGAHPIEGGADDLLFTNVCSGVLARLPSATPESTDAPTAPLVGASSPIGVASVGAAIAARVLVLVWVSRRHRPSPVTDTRSRQPGAVPAPGRDVSRSSLSHGRFAEVAGPIRVWWRGLLIAAIVIAVVVGSAVMVARQDDAAPQPVKAAAGEPENSQQEWPPPTCPFRSEPGWARFLPDPCPPDSDPSAWKDLPPQWKQEARRGIEAAVREAPWTWVCITDETIRFWHFDDRGDQPEPNETPAEVVEWCHDLGGEAVG